MRLVGPIALLLAIGCGKAGRTSEGAPTTPPQAKSAAPAPVAVPVMEVPPSAPIEGIPTPWKPIVLRGIVRPTNADSNNIGCPETIGARYGAAPIKFHVDEGPRTLYVFAKARGPVGIATARYGGSCAAAGANKWAKLALDGADGDVELPIMDVDFEGERRGQTSPYVVVVSDVDEEPKLEPALREAVDASSLLVRWSVTPRKCAQEIEYFHCWSASIDITDASGQSVAKVPLKHGLTGQMGCWPDGTGVHCGGASGMTNITLEPAKDGSGKVTVAATSQSDGYCPPPEDCTSRVNLATFAVPSSKHLVPDPKGTWPVAPARAW